MAQVKSLPENTMQTMYRIRIVEIIIWSEIFTHHTNQRNIIAILSPHSKSMSITELFPSFYFYVSYPTVLHRLIEDRFERLKV